MAYSTVYNVTLTDADTEYSLDLPAGVVELSFQARTAAAVRFAWETGKVATPTAPYATVKAGSAYTEEFDPLREGSPDGRTLYLASAAAGTVVEVTVWR